MNFLASRLLLAALFLLGAGHAAVPLAEIPVLVLAEPDAVRAGLPVQPIVPAIIQLLGHESGLNLVVRPYPWRRAQMMAEQGEGLLYGAAVSPERQRVFRFTSPLGNVNQWLVSTARSPLAFDGWEDVRGKTLSIMSGGVFSAEFEANRDSLFSVSQEATSMTGRLNMLRTGRVDAVMVASYLDAAGLEAKLNCLFPDRLPLVVAGRPIAAEPMMIAVPRSGPLSGIYAALDEAAKRLAGSQRLRDIYTPVGMAPPCRDGSVPP